MGIASATNGAVTIDFSNSDFTTTPDFSTVTTFSLQIDMAGSLQPGLVSDPAITNIQYSVSGSLSSDPLTPSGFSSFGFRLDHIFPLSPPITGTDFYGLNASSVAGGTLQYSISALADLSNGLQLNELDVLAVDADAGIGPGVIFHFNGREEGTGRYHPMFLQLYSDGTGLLQNSDNFGGINPSTLEVVDVNFGDEYITDLSFTPSNVTIAIPEPSSALVCGILMLAIALARRRV